jgi:hypothetical protein
MSSPLKQNTTTIQELLDTINTLPTAENLDTELSSQTTLISEQDAKIAELAQVLAGKAGGGDKVSYDTCTVSITVQSGMLYGYCATCFDGEEVIYKYAFSGGLGNIIMIEDVICGSSFSLIHSVGNGSVLSSNLVDVGIMNQRGSIFIAPNYAGAHATITIGNSSAD